MMHDVLIFVAENHNRYPLAVLTGVLDQEKADLPLLFLPASPDLGARVQQLARQHRRVVVAFSLMTPQLPTLGPVLAGLLPRPENVILLAGGPHPSGDPLGTLQLGFDVLVLGEGEVTLPALLRRLRAGESYDDVPGVAYLDAAGRLVCTPRPAWIDLDAYPPFSLKHRKLAAIEISRGCPWACSFCQTSFFKGGAMRHRRVETILSWLDRARAEIGIEYARFISADCFCYGSSDSRQPNLEQVEKLLFGVSRLVGQENTFFGSFPSEVRPGSVSRAGLALIKKYCANDHIVIGAQSGSPRMLKAIHRGHTIEEVFETAEMVVSTGLTCVVDFIFGLPGETPTDQELTLAAIRRLIRLGATINSHFFFPLPGTPLAHAAAGEPSKETLLFLENLTLNRQEVGRWKSRLQILTSMQAAPIISG
jgi:B12-binding domain/radical SAM domain protein